MGIRKATKKDFKEISEIFNIEAAKKPYDLNRSKKETLEKIIGYSKKHFIYLFEKDNKILGFIVANIILNNTELFIRELWIRLKYQKQGIGKALMDFIEKEHTKGKVKTISLETSAKSNSARAFYKKLNYNVTDKMVLMKKEIR